MIENASTATDTVGRMFNLNQPGADSETDGAVVARIIDIRVDLIDPDPDNYRKTFEAKEIDALAQSIAAEGLKQPITVRPHPTVPDRYMINFGERRWRAFRHLGRNAIPCIIGSGDGVRAGRILENLQRADVRPIEEAIGIAKLVYEEKAEKGEIARRLGVHQSHLSMCLKIAGMGDDLLDQISRRELSLRALYEIAKAPLDMRLKLLKKPDADLTAERVRKILEGKSKGSHPEKSARPRGSDSAEASIRDLAARTLAAIPSRPDDLDPGDRDALLALRRKIELALSGEAEAPQGECPSSSS